MNGGVPARQRHLKIEQLGWRPDVIGQAGGQSGSTLHPTIAVAADKQLNTQTMVSVAEVVEATDDKHACFKGGCFTHQGAGSASQTA